MTAVPLDPDRGEARRWAVEELSRREYAAQRPGIAERVTQWFLEQLQRVPVPDGPGNAVLLTVVLVLVGTGLAVVLWRARGLARRKRVTRSAPVLAGAVRTAEQYRAAAEEQARAGRWDGAVLDRFRAVARALEERAVLDPQPGRTADEVGAQAAAWLPALAADLAAGARTFDDVAYGERPGTPEAYRSLAALDDATAAARPAASPGVGTAPVVPR